jgi:hypothetical protein
MEGIASQCTAGQRSELSIVSTTYPGNHPLQPLQILQVLFPAIIRLFNRGFL